MATCVCLFSGKCGLEADGSADGLCAQCRRECDPDLHPRPASVPAPALEVAPGNHPRPGDVYHNDGIGEVTLAGRNTRNDSWTTNNPAVELMDSGFTSGHHKLVKARSDLATERARSAGLTRALEVARGALQEMRDRRLCGPGDNRCTTCGCDAGNDGHGHDDRFSCGIASRALTAIDAVTGEKP